MKQWLELIVVEFSFKLLVWVIIPNLEDSTMAERKNHILFFIFFQYLPRFYLTLPLRSEIINASGGLTETAWGGAAYNFMLFMLASHVSFPCLLYSVNEKW